MTAREIKIEKRTAAGIEIKKGGHIKIDQSLGMQLAVLVAFNKHDLSEIISQGNTMISLAFGPYKRAGAGGKIPYWIEKGDTVVSNRWNPMLTLTEDTFGKHDIIFDPCDSYLNTKILGQKEGYPGCRELHAEALKSWAIRYDDIPGGVNLFQNTAYDKDGMITLPTKTRESDMVVFKADMDLVVSVTACPCPLGENCSVRMEIF